MQKQNILPLFLLILTAILWTILAISPLDRHDWLMENILFFVFSTAIMATYKKFRFSNSSYILIAIFMILHLIGAHYTYAKVPFGFWISDLFNLERNHFDRIIHFSFGLFLFFPVKELLTRSLNLQGFWKYYLSIDFILCFSGFFEILEWIFTLRVSPELRQAYLGMQGDVWDAQKDMALAFLGSVAGVLISWSCGFLKQKFTSDSH